MTITDANQLSSVCTVASTCRSGSFGHSVVEALRADGVEVVRAGVDEDCTVAGVAAAPCVLVADLWDGAEIRGVHLRVYGNGLDSGSSRSGPLELHSERVLTGDGLAQCVARVAQLRRLSERMQGMAAELQCARLLYSVTTGSLWAWDIVSDAFRYVHESAPLFGAPCDFTGALWRARFHPDDAADAEKEICALLDGKARKLDIEVRMRKNNGDYVWVSLRAISDVDSSGKVLRLVGSLVDRSEAKQIRDMRLALQRSEQYYRSLIEEAQDIITTVSVDGVIRYESPAAERVLGYRARQLVGTSLYELVHPEDRKSLEETIAEGTLSQAGRSSVELRFRHRNGTWRILESLCSYLFDDTGVSEIILNMRDVTDRKKVEDHFRHAALHDTLTGLANRLLLKDRLEQALARAERSPSYLFAIFFLDLDRFKLVNDSLGHQAGDDLLVAIANRLQKLFRRTDTVARIANGSIPASTDGEYEDEYPGNTVARLGGDEFTILIEDIKDQRNIGRIAERVRALFDQPFVVDGREMFASVSMGIAVNTHGSRSAEELMRDADTAAYRAKASGRGRYEIFEPSMHASVMSRLQLESDLRRAIERNEFVPYYQPLVSANDRSILGFELLIRWIHPEHGLVPPNDFIRVAEETGMILPIGDWVVREGCRQLKAWSDMGFGDLRLALNCSPRQFQNPGLVQHVRSVVEENQLNPDRIEFEVTESVFMANEDEILSTFQQLRALGVRIAVDDFGTGYSSLSYLKRFHVTTLKIDRSFVRDMTENRDNVAIVAAIIALARSLELEVVAEGVETAAQLEALKEQGCGLVQGYLFGKPMEESQATQLLRRSAGIALSVRGDVAEA